MIDHAIQAEVFLNQIANLSGQFVLAPIGVLPELLAAVLISMATGIMMLMVFKYTSNQSAIKSVRNGINAEFLALSLFKDDVVINLGSQLRIMVGALKLIWFALVPTAVMILPVILLLGQLSLWWQARPLRIGEETVVTLNLASDDQAHWPDIHLRPCSAAATVAGPVRVRSQRAVCWTLQAQEPGIHRLEFCIDGNDVSKDLAIGDRPMRVSVRRPAWNWSEVLFHPAEAPLSLQSPARSIEIQYPSRSSWCAGKTTWLIFWLSGSTVAAWLFRKVLNVNF